MFFLTQFQALPFGLFSGIVSVPSELWNKLYQSLVMGGVMGATSEEKKIFSKNNTLLTAF